jgi:hypothetical protein
VTIFTDGLRQSTGRSIQDLDASLGESLSATLGETIDRLPTVSLFDIAELAQAKSGQTFESDEFGGYRITQESSELETPIGAARQRVKDEGFEQVLTLPDAPTIRTPALDIMISRARAERERQATIARGPDGFFAGALGVGTSFLVGAVDPLNVASAFIPVIGEARFAKLMADAGTSTAARLGVRAAVGGASGAVGQAAVEPLDAIARTQSGRDYTMADALRSVMFGAVLGGGLHAGGGAVADILRNRKGTPLYPFAPGEAAFNPEKDLFKVSPSSKPDAAPARPSGPDLIDESFLTPAAPKFVEEKSTSLLQFLASRGGLRNDDPLIGDVRAAIGSANHLVPGIGPLIRNPKEGSSAKGRSGAGDPMTLDQAREAAAEAGYIVGDGSTLRTLLDAVDGELRGNKIYPGGAGTVVDAARVERASDEEIAARESAAADLDRALAEAGYRDGDMTPAERAATIDLMLRDGLLHPLDAYDRVLTGGPSPVVAMLDDLPPQAKEDLLRGAIARLADGEPVAAGEMIEAAARTDPRIGESGEPGAKAPTWRDLAERPRDFDSPEAVGASQGAQAAPEPPSIAPEANKRIQAAEAAAAQAEAEYKAAELSLPDDLKARVERDLAELDAEAADRALVIERGAACLASLKG